MAQPQDPDGARSAHARDLALAEGEIPPEAVMGEGGGGVDKRGKGGKWKEGDGVGKRRKRWRWEKKGKEGRGGGKGGGGRGEALRPPPLALASPRLLSCSPSAVGRGRRGSRGTLSLSLSVALDAPWRHLEGRHRRHRCLALVFPFLKLFQNTFCLL